jgi:hypothetical protein
VDEEQIDFGPDMLRMSPEAMLLPIVVAEPSRKQLRLLAWTGKEVQIVFERTISDAGCEATVAFDEFGTFPYPLKVALGRNALRPPRTRIGRQGGAQIRRDGRVGVCISLAVPADAD